MSYRTLSSADLKGKKVLLRAGFDLPMKEGKVVDRTRVEALVPTMKHILDQGALLIIMAHQGRPKSKNDSEFSQKPVVPVLEKLLGVPVHFASDCIGDVAKKTVTEARNGEVVLLENLRFHPEEKENDEEFGKSLASLADVYVNDAFTNCHREHASMVQVPKHLPSYMGLSLEKEVENLGVLLDAPKKPLTLIVSGAKMETKVPVIERFLARGDNILVGGCIANTFIAASGKSIGKSKCDQTEVPKAKELLEIASTDTNATIHVPTDVTVAEDKSAEAVAKVTATDAIPDGSAIFDIGTETMKRYASIIQESKTIVWNGPLGVYEIMQFSHGTKSLAEAVSSATTAGATSLLGGGDTIDFHLQYDVPLDKYSFVSMGGGAMLEFIAGKTFDSLEILKQ